MRSFAIGSAILLAACGGSGSQPRCGGDADCAAGTVCERPVSGERGVCVAPFAVALTAPAAGGWAGLSTPVAATVAVTATGRVFPAGADLLVDGVPAAALARQGNTGLYRGTLDLAGRLSPAQLQRGTVALAAVVARGTRDEAASAPVTVRVDLDGPALAASAGCGAAACLRDAVLPVRATVTDAQPALLAVTARLDLDPARTVTLQRTTGDDFAADVDLSAWPFAALAREVQVTVAARDQAGNERTQVVAAAVTRVRWEKLLDPTAGFKASGAAIDPTGQIVVGGSNGRLYVVAPNGDVVASPQIAAGAITAAPSIGVAAAWATSEDGRVYAVNLSTGTVLNAPGCNAGGALQGTPAIGGTTETAFVGSGIGRLFAADASGTCVQSLPTDAFSASPAIARSGLVLAATATATATLRQYRYEGAFGENWAVQVGVNVQAPIAIDASDGAWTGSQDAKLNLTTPAGATSTVKTLGGSIQDSPVILAGGDVVVGDQARVLHRIRPDGTLAWPSEPVLDGAVLAPLVLAGGDALLLVPTAAGTLHAVAADGTVAWSGALSAQPLRAGNLGGQPGAPFSTAYFGAADGKLYAVVVDGHLDTAAPWPKAHHDVRNTSNAAFPHP